MSSLTSKWDGDEIYDDERWKFIAAVEEYRRINDRRFPTLSEIYDIVLWLGYRPVSAQLGSIEEASQLKGESVTEVGLHWKRKHRWAQFVQEIEGSTPRRRRRTRSRDHYRGKGARVCGYCFWAKHPGCFAPGEKYCRACSNQTRERIRRRLAAAPHNLCPNPITL